MTESLENFTKDLFMGVRNFYGFIFLGPISLKSGGHSLRSRNRKNAYIQCFC